MESTNNPSINPISPNPSGKAKTKSRMKRSADSNKLLRSSFSQSSLESGEESENHSIGSKFKLDEIPAITCCCVPLKYMFIAVAVCNNISMISYGLLMTQFDITVFLKIIPVFIYLYLSALFVNVLCKPRK